MNLGQSITNQSGRWSRQGSTIVVDLGGGSTAEEQEVPTPPTRPFLQRVMHPRIDVDAQRALITMNNSGDPDATQLMTLVELGILHGIFKPDQAEPALLIRKLGGNWWEYLRPGERGRLLCHAAGKISLVFRKNLTRAELIALLKELAAAFRSIAGRLPCTGPGFL